MPVDAEKRPDIVSDEREISRKSLPGDQHVARAMGVPRAPGTARNRPCRSPILAIKGQNIDIYGGVGREVNSVRSDR